MDEKTAKKRLEENIAKHEQYKAAMKWICDDCDSDFAEPLNLDFGLDEGWHCPYCNSMNIHEKSKT